MGFQSLNALLATIPAGFCVASFCSWDQRLKVLPTNFKLPLGILFRALSVGQCNWSAFGASMRINMPPNRCVLMSCDVNVRLLLLRHTSQSWSWWFWRRVLQLKCNCLSPTLLNELLAESGLFVQLTEHWLH